MIAQLNRFLNRLISSTVFDIFFNELGSLANSDAIDTNKPNPSKTVPEIKAISMIVELKIKEMNKQKIIRKNKSL